ncbi:MAG: 50S ribosomal protein L35 [Planctomycetaceae bacterium]|nr:50S ribosomal protein L35 [Planctomycetaceae bacterium]
MPKLKTHKGMKKRFKVSANGKVLHKRCGSSHLMSHKNGKQVRRLRKKSALNLAAESRRVRSALRDRNALNPLAVEAAKRAALAAKASAAVTAADNPSSPAPAAAVTTAAEQPSSPAAVEPRMDDN